jgi:hypothetical protein
MIKKYLVLIGVIISLAFFSVAISIYPGGTYQDKNAIGFNWTKNYFSNLFETSALNGGQNPSIIWAYIGIFFYAISSTIFFVNMSKKIPEKNVGNFIRYTGILTLPTTFLVITPLHDIMLTISNFLFWTCITTITVYIIKSRLHFLKFYCMLCMLIFYIAVYIHSSSNWDLLPIAQKINTISSILLILVLEYFTRKEDFAHIKTKKQKLKVTCS